MPRTGLQGPRSNVVAAGSVATAISLPVLSQLESSPVPLGVFPAAVLAAYLVFLGFQYFRRWSAKGEVPPKTAALRRIAAAGSPGAPAVSPTGLDGLTPEPPAVPWPVPAWSEAAVGAGRAPPARRVRRGGEARIWTVDGEVPLPGDWKPRTIAVAPPSQRLFGRNLTMAFIGVALLLLAFHAYVFYALDRIVAAAGRLMFWPLDWPGLIHDPGLHRTLPDYVFLMYLGMMLAFVVATGLYTNARFSRTQRRDALLILLGYLATEVAVDIFFFSVSNRFVGSSFLVVRGAVGGLYFALLVFSTLHLPPALRIERVLPRDTRATVWFVGLTAASLGVSVVVLYLLFHFLGLGSDLIPFAVLLLAPLIALVVFGGLGRLLYDRQVAQRPPPPLSRYHPAVSILIPAYNESENVVATIRSADLAAARYPGRTEIVVANDGSRDNTSALAKEAIRELKHATGAVIDLPHGGKSQALNGGLAAARGEVIVRVDGDTRISTARGFGELVRHLGDPEVGGVQGLILPLQQEGWTRKLRFLEIAWNHLYLRRGMMVTRCAQVVDGSFCAFRRKDLVALGGWVSWNGEDTEITLRLQRLGYRMRFETGAAAFEDVPDTLPRLRSQRIRWNRGGIIAHRRHMTGLFSDAFEYGGLPILFWFTLFIRGGLRSMVWIYAAFATLLLWLPTLLDVAVITVLLLVPRGIVLGYYLIKFHKWRWLPYIATWPLTGTIKQYFTLESFGSLLPGGAAEFSE